MTCWLFFAWILTHWLQTVWCYNQVKSEGAPEPESKINLCLAFTCWRFKTSYWVWFFCLISILFNTIFPINAFLRVLSKGSNWFLQNVLYKSTLRGFHSTKTKLKAITLSWFDKHTVSEFLLNILNGNWSQGKSWNLWPTIFFKKYFFIVCVKWDTVFADE